MLATMGRGYSLPEYILGGSSFITAAYAFSFSIFRVATYETENLHQIFTALTRSVLFGPIILLAESYITGHAILGAEFNNIFLYGATIAQLWMFRHIYIDIVGGRPFRPVDLTGKVYIVTGSNTGIGFQTAKELVRMGATVVLACRSPDKAKEAKEKIMKETNSNKIIVSKLDLCGFDSVRKFVKEFREIKLPLHGLINNAGVMMEEKRLTQDGFEMVFTANHLSHFLLTNLLLPELEKTNGRIINVSSSLYHMTKSFNFDDVMSEKHYSLFSTYSQSKLANILFTLELQRRLKKQGSKVTCNVVHPGAVRTEVTRHMSPLMQTLNNLFVPVLSFYQKSPLQGAYCSIFVATDPSLEGIGGEYFIDSKAYPLNKAATDERAAGKLWEISEKLTGLKR